MAIKKWNRRHFLIAGSAAAIGSRASFAAARIRPNRGPNAFTLTCQSLIDPIGIDTPVPHLSWIYHTRQPGYRQSAYQVRVASSRTALVSGEADIWRSGRIFSDQNVQVPFAGKTLQSRSEYFWQVRVWDQDGVASDWSPVACWTMGILDPLEWRAQWITSPIMEKVHEPRRIFGWKRPAHVTGGRVFYRVRFFCPQRPCFYHVYLAVTGSHTAFLNGTEIIRSQRRDAMECFIGADHPRLDRGWNVLAIDATAATRFDAAAGVTVVMPGGVRRTLMLNQWKYHYSPIRGWQAPAFDDTGWASCADSAPFGRQDWATPDMNFDAPRRSFLLRREFAVEGIVRRAVVLVSGLGSCELHLNGRRVDDHLLSPNWTQYQRRIEYDMHDVTPLIQSGTNCIGAILGNSWWSSGLGPMQSQRAAAPGDNLKCFCELHIDYADGSHQVICSDDNWRVHPSPIMSDSIYNGETYDARLESPGWNEPRFDDSAWFSAQSAPISDGIKFSARTDEPIRIIDTIEPRLISEPAPGMFVLDFGQNHSGVMRIRVREPAGRRIELRHAESIYPNGRVNGSNLQSAAATDVYICAGSGVETWMPRFTYHGYRYVEIKGLSRRPTPGDFTAMVLGTAVAEVSTFQCSKPIYNIVDRMARWSGQSNTFSVLTDCPQRDSRTGSMGDGAAFVRTACWNQKAAAFFRKWTLDMADAADFASASRHSHLSEPTIIAPSLGGEPIGCPGRSDAAAVVPYTSFIFNGDLLELRQAYALMRDWALYILANRTGGVFSRPDFGDWMATVPTSEELISAAIACRSVQIAARAARWVAPHDAEHFHAAAGSMATAFNARFLNRREFQYGNGSQCANLLPLAFHLVPQWAQRGVIQNVVQDITARQGISTGYVGTPHLLPTLSRFGYHRLAATLLAQTRYPSLGYMAIKGCTTVAERWDFDRCGPFMNSLNHTVFGSMCTWLYEGLMGIEPDEHHPGFKHFTMRPIFLTDMTHAEFEHHSPYGRIACTWQRRHRRIDLHVQIPPNTTSDIYLVDSSLGISEIRAGAKLIYRHGRSFSSPNMTAMRDNLGNRFWRLGSGRIALNIIEV